MIISFSYNGRQSIYCSSIRDSLVFSHSDNLHCSVLSRLHQAKICNFFLQAKKEEEREKAVAAGNQRWEGAEHAEPWGLTL